jgi:hypothetical protein
VVVRNHPFESMSGVMSMTHAPEPTGPPRAGQRHISMALTFGTEALCVQSLAQLDPHG